MICTPLTTHTVESLKTHKTGEDRSPGLHLSDVIKSVMQDLNPKTYGKAGSVQTFDTTTLTRFEAGFTFEEMMEHAFAARRVDVARVGEVELDGIAGSPDGINVTEDPGIVVETKFTWKSMRGTPWPCEEHTEPMRWCESCGPQEWDSKHLAWLLQMQGYCKMLNLHRAQLWALFVNGSYSPAGSPVLRVWQFEWTQGELDATWAMFLRQAREKGLLKARSAA